MKKKIPRPHFQNRRRVFRLRIPADALLDATVNGKAYKVVEVSEFGLVVSSNEIENIDGQCEGVIRWSDGRTTKFTGEVGRLSDFGRVIWKVNGVPMSDIVRAQRQQILRFPLRGMVGKSA